MLIGLLLLALEESGAERWRYCRRAGRNIPRPVCQA